MRLDAGVTERRSPLLLLPWVTRAAWWDATLGALGARGGVGALLMRLGAVCVCRLRARVTSTAAWGSVGGTRCLAWRFLLCVCVLLDTPWRTGLLGRLSQGRVCVWCSAVRVVRLHVEPPVRVRTTSVRRSRTVLVDGEPFARRRRADSFCGSSLSVDQNHGGCWSRYEALPHLRTVARR